MTFTTKKHITGSSKKRIGAKTAAVFLMFNYQRGTIRHFPVDTHIFRVSLRLGIINPKTNREKLQKLFSESVPTELIFRLHVNFIELGRNLCKSNSPLCPECPLSSICPKNF
jgi:endonuclease-3